MVGFTADAYPDIIAGRRTVTWRLWKYAHVKAGRKYNLGSWDDAPGSIVIDDVRTVRVVDVTDADAREVGQPNAETLVAFCASHTGAVVTPDTLLHRVAFHWSPEVLRKPPCRWTRSPSAAPTRRDSPFCLDAADAASDRGVPADRLSGRWPRRSASRGPSSLPCASSRASGLLPASRSAMS